MTLDESNRVMLAMLRDCLINDIKQMNPNSDRYFQGLSTLDHLNRFIRGENKETIVICKGYKGENKYENFNGSIRLH